MITQLFLLISGLLLLIVGSNYLLKSAVDLSIKLNLSKVVIGLTVVSFATSAPELLISISSALKGSADIAISNVIGSNIANLGLVLGTALCFTKIKIPKSNMKFDWTFLMIISFLFFYFINDLSVNRFEGVLLFLALILFLVFIIKIRDDSDVEEIKITTSSNYKILILILFSSTLLYYGSELFVNSSIYFAEYFGVSERVIGLTLVAIGTSLPELVTTLVAIYKSELDISIGNIIGSNIFNILAVMGATALIHPIQIVDQALLSNDMYWMLAVSISILPLVFFPRFMRLGRYEGLFLLSFYALFIYQMFS